jgi:SAM-dependent methyltransferase
MPIDFGSLRRVVPISRYFGFDRGMPIDRYYIEKFLQRHAEDVKGRTLEIGDDNYSKQLGGNRTTKRDVLHVQAGNPAATFVGDLTNADHIPSDTFDCFVLTQTIHLIIDVAPALKVVQRVLKPGGIVLATFPGISQISVDEWSKIWCWSFTSRSAARLFGDVFGDNFACMTFGNTLAATCFLQGMAAEELPVANLDHHDPNCELLIAVRAWKAARSACMAPDPR